MLFLQFSQAAAGHAPIAAAADQDTRDGAEIKKLHAETEKLQAEKRYYEKSPWFSLAQYTIGFLAIIIPVALAFKQVGEQRSVMRERAQVDASLKAAEIAMSAAATDQVRARALMLGALLKDFVPDFGDKLLSDPMYNSIGLASYRTRFAALLDAIAGHPDEALLFAEIYNLLYPDDDRNSRGRITALLEKLQRGSSEHHQQPSQEAAAKIVAPRSE